MLLTYQPPGADPRSWAFDPQKMMSSEAEACEKATGLTWDEFGVALLKGSRTARRCLLWVLMKRTEPTLRHSQIDPPVGSILLEYERAELLLVREGIVESDEFDDDERDAALAVIDREIETAPGGDDEGKARENSDDSPDSATSPTSLASARRKASG